jgi:hypothetical protein
MTGTRCIQPRIWHDDEDSLELDISQDLRDSIHAAIYMVIGRQRDTEEDISCIVMMRLLGRSMLCQNAYPASQLHQISGTRMSALHSDSYHSTCALRRYHRNTDANNFNLIIVVMANLSTRPVLHWYKRSAATVTIRSKLAEAVT